MRYYEYMLKKGKEGYDKTFPDVGFIKDDEVIWGRERDNVNHPSHYNESGIECIEAIRATLGAEGFEAYCKGNCMKYLWRYQYKNGLEDLKKAQVYLNWMIESLEKREEDD